MGSGLFRYYSFPVAALSGSGKASRCNDTRSWVFALSRQIRAKTSIVIMSVNEGFVDLLDANVALARTQIQIRI